jgi:hypothetical protein
MAKNSDEVAPAREKSPWLQIAQFLFLVGLAVAVFLLAQSMVHHRFFRGGWVNQNGTLRPSRALKKSWSWLGMMPMRLNP